MAQRNYSAENRDAKYGKVWREVWERDGGICQLCKATQDICIDHIVSVKRGGKSTLNNMRLLCRSCNSKHSHRELKPHLQKTREYYREWRKQNPDLVKRYRKEWRAKHPGYNTQGQLEFRKLYRAVRSS